jgi:hypothetical protein
MFVLVEAHDAAYEPLAQITLHQNKKLYCEKHGYVLHYSDDLGVKASGGRPQVSKLPPIPDEYFPSGWGKIFVMREAMEKYPEAEWIFNIDTDAMITNMDKKLEDLVRTVAVESTHVAIPADCNGINCGVMLVRNSPIGKAFLETVIAGMPLYRHWYMFENQLIQDLAVGTHLEEDGMHPGGTFWARVIRVVPQRVMNSYDYRNLPRLAGRKDYNDILGSDGQWQPGDFVIQWPSTDLEFRIKAAKGIKDHM